MNKKKEEIKELLLENAKILGQMIIENYPKNSKYVPTVDKNGIVSFWIRD